jgi:hypothetical protein
LPRQILSLVRLPISPLSHRLVVLDARLIVACDASQIDGGWGTIE